jgi:hypothetical protein
MPNWVKNSISFEGSDEKIKEMLNSIQSVDKNGEISYIDFEKIIPMPESLKIDSGSSTDNGIALVKYLVGDDSLLKEMLSYSWVKNANITTTKQLFENFQSNENFNSLIDAGKKAIYNLENFGYTGWYSWSCDNWGTKWNASSSYLHDNNILEFETAWSNPYPVLLELSSKFPDIKFTVEYADEDIGSNCGRYVLQGGNQIEFTEYDGIKACEIWGYDPAEFYPDIFRDQQIDKILGDKEE